MMSNNKILTVSYGTFSCTLEGFEDSFGTMKAIAEYFRDLAQDDRYFGAEPPQPDAEMLARIAEREIERRVRGHSQDGTVVLRAAAPVPTPDQAPAPVPAAPSISEQPNAAAPAAPVPPIPPASAVAPPEPAAAPAMDARVATTVAAGAAVAASLAADAATDDGDTEQELAAPAAQEPRAEEIDAASASVSEDSAPEDVTSAEDMAPESETPEDIAPEEMAALGEEAPEEPVVEEDTSENVVFEQTAPEDVQSASDVATALSESEQEGTPVEAVQAEITEQQEEVAVAEQATGSESSTLQDDAEEADPLEAIAEDLDAAFEAEDAPAREAPVETLEAPPAAPGMDGSIAAKLQRIRDVVARNQNEGAMPYSEDEHAEDAGASAFDGAGFEDEEDSAHSTLMPSFEDEDVQALSAIDAALAEAEVEADTDVDSEPVLSAAEPTDTETVLEDDDAQTLAAIDAALAETAEPEATNAANYAPTQDKPAPDLEAAPRAKPPRPDLPPHLVPPELPDLPKPRARVRVIKVKREDLKAAIDEGTLEEINGAAQAPVPEPQPTPKEAAATPKAEAELDAVASSLSEEDEADLLRELAEVEAEISNAAPSTRDITLGDLGDPEEVDLPAPARDAFDFEGSLIAGQQTQEMIRAEEKASKRQKAAEAGVEDSAMDRLMAEANTHMDDPEGTSRRAAFDHLRAAVVATRDDDALSAEATEDASDDAYRTDLAEAVVPRRPKPSSKGYTGAERRAQSRPAPLKLVAEQRVDTPGARTGPVRPRRVAAEDVAPQAEINEAESFADYAATQGAHALPDLLEAAASYLSFVEGREQFSRPQLMTKVRQVGPKDFTREDGLRSFGQLLRAGKIEKIKGGRFTVSDEIGFQPDDRKAG